ncbi:patatin-like phospholipase family protein [Vogesella sp. GCM10023246]|uniref:Patatin-like phospholipase family protein n=1 Tax=Vogesella oryzagri TaxID=3160864 RepID=A0ABV1M666_9NEIS
MPLSRRLLLLALITGLAACSTPTAPVVKIPAKPKIAFALGGGAAKGFAHVGVIRVLEQNGIKADIVTGTSAGSVVGAIYASGVDGDALRYRALRIDEADLRDFTLSTSGFLKGEKLAALVNQQVDGKKIEQMPRKFGVVATNLDSGARIVFRSGDTGTAVRASAAIPNVFQPVTIAGKRYVDGGLVSPVPVSAAREMGADIVIAVDISAKPVGKAAAGFFSLLDRSLSIMNMAALAQELKQADVVIRPNVLNIGAADFDERGNAILEGEKAARAALPQLKAVIARWQQQHG